MCTVQIQFLHVGFVHDSLRYHECCCLSNFTKRQIQLLKQGKRTDCCSKIVLLRADKYVLRPELSRDLTLRIGSPSLRTAARAMAPSQRTRQSPKLITWTFLRCPSACGPDRRRNRLELATTLAIVTLSQEHLEVKRPHLCHGQCSSLCEGVVIEVDDTQLWVVSHG